MGTTTNLIKAAFFLMLSALGISLSPPVVALGAPAAPPNVTIVAEGTSDDRRGLLSIIHETGERLFDVPKMMPGDTESSLLRFQNKDTGIVDVRMVVRNAAADQGLSPYDLADILQLKIIDDANGGALYSGGLKQPEDGGSAHSNEIYVGKIPPDGQLDLVFLLTFPGEENPDPQEKYRHNNYMYHETEFEVLFYVTGQAPLPTASPEPPPPTGSPPPTDRPEPTDPPEPTQRPEPEPDGAPGITPAPSEADIIQIEDDLLPEGNPIFEPSEPVFELEDEEIPGGSSEFDEMPQTGEGSLVSNLLAGGGIILLGILYILWESKKGKKVHGGDGHD